jgi:hypothetical protein
MSGYQVFMHVDLLEAMPRTGIQRRQIMDFIRGLRDNSHMIGDFTDKDASLRIREVKLIGDYAITYWVDSPVKAVMIADLRPADK